MHIARLRKNTGLPFPLLLDPDKKIAKAYGAENGIPDPRPGPENHVRNQRGRAYPRTPIRQVDPGNAHANEIIADSGS